MGKRLPSKSDRPTPRRSYALTVEVLSAMRRVQASMGLQSEADAARGYSQALNEIHEKEAAK